MSTLLIVRHGQASFGSPDYDQLSPMGYVQSERLGRFLGALHASIDAVYTGPARRHRQTLEGILRGAEGSPLKLPLAQVSAGLGEFPAFQLYTLHENTALPGAEGEDPITQLARTFERICAAWMRGSIDSGKLETALDFEARVVEAMRAICAEQGQGKTVLVITSGGPTMIAMKSVLALDAGKACELLWAIANSSFSEFRYSGTKTSLVAFNRIPHLESQHITYR